MKKKITNGNFFLLLTAFSNPCLKINHIQISTFCWSATQVNPQKISGFYHE